MSVANSRLQQLLTRLAERCVARAHAVVAVGVLVTALAAVYLAANVAVDTNLDDLIDRDAPFRERQRALEDAFPALRDRVVLVVDAPSLDARLAATHALATALERRDDVAEAIFAPATLDVFERQALLFDDVATLERRLDRLAGAQPLLARIAGDARPTTLVATLANGLERGETTPAFGDALDALAPIFEAAAAGEARPIPWLELTRADAPTRPLVVEARPVLDFARIQPAGPALDAMRALVARIEASYPGSSVAITGEIALEAEELEAAGVGAATALSLSLVLVLVVLAVGMRSAGAIAAILLTLVSGLILTGAFAVAGVGAFTMISIAFAVLVIGLGVDFAIHLSLRAQEESGRGRAWSDAVVAAVRGVGPALLLCGPTTALAFASFWPTAYVGLAQLGLIAGVGMLILLVLTLTLLPALLRSLARPRSLVAPSRARVPPSLMQVAAVAIVAAGVAAPAFVGEVRFAADPLALKDPDAPSVTAFRALLEEAELSPYRAELLVEGEAEAAAARTRLLALDEVGRVVGIDRFVPEDQARKLALIEDARFFLDVPAPQPAPAATPAELERELRRLADVAPDPAWREASLALAERVAAEPGYARTLQEAWFRFWPQALTRLGALLDAGPMTADDLATALRERYVDDAGRQRLEILPAAPLTDADARRAFADAVLAAVPDAAGNVVQMTRAADVVAGAMVQASVTALVAVTLLVALVLRRWVDVAAVMLTVLLAASLTLGAMALFDIPFNFANVIVLPLLLGMGVDAAIHVVVRAREQAGRGLVVLTSTPRAVLLSALTTLASFGTLMLSPHQGTASMGLLLALAMLANLAAALVVLPTWLDRGKRS